MSGLTDFAIQSLLTGASHPGTLYLQLHTGDPGPTGVNNVSTSPLRQPITLSVAIDEGVNVENVSFPITAPLEGISNWSAFDADAGGNCWWIGDFTNGRTVSAGDVVLVGSGDLSFRIRRTA